MHRAFLIVSLFLVLTHVASASAIPPVSCQGVFERTNPGPYRLEIQTRAQGLDVTGATLRITDPRGGIHEIRQIPGMDFFVGANGRIVALERPETDVIESRMVIYDLEGRRLHARDIAAPYDPALSADAMALVLRDTSGGLRIDLNTFDESRFPSYEIFAAGPDGRIAGVPYGDENLLELRAQSGRESIIPLDARPRRLAFDAAGAVLYVLDATMLTAVTGDARRTIYIAPAGTELTDLRIADGRIYVGERRMSGTLVAGSSVELDAGGGVIDRASGPVEPITEGVTVPASDRGIPWPLMPNAQHAVGNTWGEYQNYGGTPYPHPGFDIFGSAGQGIYAVRSGVVKAVLTTGGDLYWRVAIGDSVTAGTCKGYLYAHLAQSSIAVHVGDLIFQGQYIGNLVQWPSYNFTHCHFARIQQSGTQWNGSWLAVDNPHTDLQNQNDTHPPVFEPARGSDLLAFCNNETSTYQSPASLHGAVDIICHVGDQIESSWVCSVQALRYTIYPINRPQYPVVNDKLAQVFNMTIDYYAGGSDYLWLNTLLYKDDSVCNTQGDYDYREFYHIISNSDGDGLCEQTDAQEAWNTAALPDGQYVVKVRAFDAAGNVTADSMVVTTVNGNPSDADEQATTAELRADVFPNPSTGMVHVSFTIPIASSARIAVYDPSGRRVRTLADRQFAAGAHTIVWDGRDDRDRRVSSGSYTCRIETGDGRVSQKIIRSR